jgi:hypothetical protein
VNARSRGISHNDAKLGVVVMASTSRAAGARMPATVRRICASMFWHASNSFSPAGVSTSARCWRANSGTPRSSSSARICRLTADCVTKRSAAARVNDRWRAAASKASSRSSGGRRSMSFRMR